MKIPWTGRKISFTFFVTLLIVLIGILGALYENAQDPRLLARYRDRIGKALPCTDGDLFAGQQAEVLAYGLEDVTGLAVRDGRVYIAQAGRPFFVLQPDDPTRPAPQPWFQCVNGDCDERRRRICPDGVCDALSPLGVSISGNRVLFARHGRILEQTLDPDSGLPADTEPLPVTGMETVPNPTGLSKTTNTLFVTADSSPFSPLKDHTHSGQLIAIPMDATSAPAPLPTAFERRTGLDRPSGVVALGDSGPVYVTEETDGQVRWSVFRKEGPNWIRDSLLATVQETQPSSRFLGMAIWSDLQAEAHGWIKPAVLFAAGPQGLYAFSSNGAALGRVEFEEPVSGVAVWNNSIYMIVGHLLCRITILPKQLNLPSIAKPTPGLPPTPND